MPAGNSAQAQPEKGMRLCAKRYMQAVLLRKTCILRTK